MNDRENKLVGCLVGTAVGDSLGLPYEGLGRSRARKIFGDGSLHQRLIFGRGMISDDTEHAAMVAEALIESGGQLDIFEKSLVRRMKMWLLAIPAGVGLATLRAIIRLWLGANPGKSGVYSAGNGPVMRAPIIGAYASGNRELLKELVACSTRMTHSDPRAEEGAFLVALASAYGAEHGQVADIPSFMSSLKACVTDPELLSMIGLVEKYVLSGSSTEEFAEAIGCSDAVSGFINHTVPAALFCWLRHREDPNEAIAEVIRMGGDADTTGAIVGGLVGATYGLSRLNHEWVDGIRDWPRSVQWLKSLGTRLSNSSSNETVKLFTLGIPPRNLVFLCAVLYHGFRRLFPPY